MKVTKVSPTAQLLTSTNSLAEQLLAFSRTPVIGRNCYTNEETGSLPIYSYSSAITNALMVPKQEHVSPEPTEHEQNVTHAYDFFHLDPSSSPAVLKICHDTNGATNGIIICLMKFSRSFTPSDRGAFYDPSQNVIDVMVDAYRHLLERRRLIYCPSSIRDILGGTMPPPRPAKFYERVKREKLRVEIAFYVEFLNSIHPFPKLNVDDKARLLVSSVQVALVKHLSVSFSILEKHYVFYRFYKNLYILSSSFFLMIIHSDGTYTDLDDPDSIVFEVKDVAGERMDNETLNKLFIQPLRDSLLEISGPMYHSNMTDVEFCALIAILLFDPAAPGLDDSVRRIVKDARDKVYHDWFAYYNQLGVEDASQRVGNTMLLLPAVQASIVDLCYLEIELLYNIISCLTFWFQTTVEKTQESFHLIRVFELFEYDKILDELLDMSGDNY
uniref:NR LBD domain-containing protein n=1 Tax=Heterorhabditis bacteriophora TaxID=37862 RepID=A0A1I7WNK9_HETBA